MRCGSAVNGLALVAAFAAGLPLAATSAAQPGQSRQPRLVPHLSRHRSAPKG